MVGTGAAEKVFVTEPSVHVRPSPALRNTPARTAHWGESYERVKTIGRWTRIRVTEKSDGFVWAAWLVSYDRLREKPFDERGLEIHFAVDRYLAEPVLEAMCRDILGVEREKAPKLGEFRIKGFLFGEYPDGPPLCDARWSEADPPEGTGGELQVGVPVEEAVSKRDVEIHDWVTNLFKSESRGGKSIFECDSLWVEAAAEFELSPAKVRYTYDRVRWRRQGSDE